MTVATKAWMPPISPHPGQVQMIQAALKYQTCIWAVGRRYGKTRGAIQLVFIEGGRCAGRVYKFMYCSPTYRRAREVYMDFVHLYKPFIKKKRDTDLYVELKPYGKNAGVRAWFVSLEQHDNLRGEGLDRVVVDECADVVQRAYYATLAPMLADTAGKALLIGTPKRVGVGFLWFRTEFVKGTDQEGYPHHFSGHGPSEENPFLDEQALAMLREQCIDDLMRREEYDAEWVTEEGAVFERLEEAFSLPVQRTEGTCVWIGSEPTEGGRYIAGLDLARFGDFTVLSIFDRRTRNQVAVMRVRGEEYEYQLKLIHDLRQRYNKCLLIVDEAGAGTPILERLRRAYKDGAKARKWNNRTKEEDITRGRILFQRAAWKFLDLKWQFNEFQVYTREKLQLSGAWRYQAPEGMHDDAVAAACLATEQIALPWVEPGLGQTDTPYFTIEQLDKDEKSSRWRRYFKRFGR